MNAKQMRRIAREALRVDTDEVQAMIDALRKIAGEDPPGATGDWKAVLRYLRDNEGAIPPACWTDEQIDAIAGDLNANPPAAA